MTPERSLVGWVPDRGDVIGIDHNPQAGTRRHGPAYQSRSLGSLEHSPLINWELRLGLHWRFGGPVKEPAPVATP